MPRQPSQPRATPPASPGVRFPPPTLFAVGFLAGWLLHRLHALPLLPGAFAAREPAGLLLLALGLACAGWGLLTFLRARTAIIPHNPASRLVTSGPYRFSRNPMYTGLTIAYLGLTLLLGSAWPLLFLPLVLAALVALVIRREEAYLLGAFGEEYRQYTRRVRRWL